MIMKIHTQFEIKKSRNKAFFVFDRQGLPPKWPDITATNAHKPHPFRRPQPNQEAPRGEFVNTAKASHSQPEWPKSLLQWDGNTAVGSWLRPNGLRSQPNGVCRDGFAKAADAGCAGRPLQGKWKRACTEHHWSPQAIHVQRLPRSISAGAIVQLVE